LVKFGEYNQRRADWHSRLKELNDQEKAEASKTKDGIFFAWFDELISQSKEVPQILHRDELRSIIAGALSYHDNIRYELLAYCIMPNHVHVLILPIINHNDTIFSPARILFTWKRFTTKAINKTLNRKGALWQKENYDRMVRDETELYNTINYIIQNPVKAGLVSQWEDWAGTYVRPDFFS